MAQQRVERRLAARKGTFPWPLLIFPLGRFEEAAAAAAKAVQLNPTFSIPHAQQFIALVKFGRMEAARAAADRLLQLMPEFKVDMLTRVASAPSEILADWAQSLRSAGVPG
jgi:hypothetical protein